MTRPGSGMMYRSLLAIAFAVFFASNFALVVPHQRITKRIREAAEQTRRLTAANICRDLERTSLANVASIGRFLESTRTRYPGLTNVRFVPGDATLDSLVPSSPEYVCRTDAGTLVIAFDNAPLESLLRTTQLASVISFIALAAAFLLVVVNLVAVQKPLRHLLRTKEEPPELDPRQSESTFLIDSFQTAIGSLRTQEQEFKRLHAMEKSRADELARITNALTRSITSGFISFDPQGRVFDMNDVARTMLGIEPGQPAAGQDIAALIGDTSFARNLREANESRSSLQRTEVEHEGERSLSIGLTTVPIHDEENAYLGTLALFTDLTPIRNLETRLRETRTLADLGEMSAGIAHEFRNSLATILGFLKLAHRANASPEVERRLAEAETEARALSDAVMGLLNFARPTKLDLRPVDVPDLVAQLAQRLVALGTGVQLDMSIEPFTIDGDPALLSRAFENIIRNAIEAIHEAPGVNGTIRIESRAGSHPSVTIQDNGVGIDPAEVPRLMLPFNSGKASGMGLGLPLARKIILLHGGNLTIGGAPGTGCLVQVTFGLDVDASGPANRPPGQGNA